MQPWSSMRLAAMCEVWRERRGGGGPNQTKIKIKQKLMKHSLLNTTNATSAAISITTTTTRCIQKTYWRHSALPNEKDEPKMTKARCSLWPQCGWLQCVRYGERGVAVAAQINPTNKIKIKIKQKLMKHSLLKKTKHTNFGTKKQSRNHNSLHQTNSLPRFSDFK